jgi:hypothetical protein
MDCGTALIVLGIMILLVLALGSTVKSDTNGDGTPSTKSRSSSNGIWLPLRERRRIRRFFKR